MPGIGEATLVRPRPAEAPAGFRNAVIAGLGRRPKAIPCQYFYDQAGAALFARICTLPEYYLTRTEIEILSENAEAIASGLPPSAVLVEFGSGTSCKADFLLDQVVQPLAYVPIDVSASCLVASSRRLTSRYPGLRVIPVCADFTRPLVLPKDLPAAPRIGFFSGSTIGNFDTTDAALLLRRFAATLGAGCHLIVGVDRKKDARLLHAAYNDAEGVTAAFNLNLLVRANSELGADFDLASFAHRAVYNRVAGRIEMHLISLRAQSVHIGGEAFDFASGETIHTENCYKYDLPGFAELAANAGLAVIGSWSDPRALFTVHTLAG